MPPMEEVPQATAHERSHDHNVAWLLTREGGIQSCPTPLPRPHASSTALSASRDRMALYLITRESPRAIEMGSLVGLVSGGACGPGVGGGGVGVGVVGSGGG